MQIIVLTVAVLLHPTDYLYEDLTPTQAEKDLIQRLQRKYFGQLLKRTEYTVNSITLMKMGKPFLTERTLNTKKNQQLIRSYINEEAHLNASAARTNHHVSKIKVHSLGGFQKSIKNAFKNDYVTQERTQACMNSAIDEKKYLWDLNEEEASNSVFLTDHQLLMTMVNIEHLTISGTLVNEHGREVMFRDGHVFNCGKLSGFTKHVGIVTHDKDILNSVNLSTMRYTNSLNTMRLCELSPMTMISPNLLAEIERANTTIGRHGTYRSTLHEIMPGNTDSIPTPFVTVSTSNPKKSIKGYVTYEDQLMIEIFLMSDIESIDEVVRLVNNTDAERLRRTSGYKKVNKSENENTIEFFKMKSIRVRNIKDWGEKNTPWARFHCYPQSDNPANFTQVMDTHFMAKYLSLTSGRPNKTTPAPWDINQSRLYDWTPETMHHDMLRLITRHPHIRKVEMSSTLEEDYIKMDGKVSRTIMNTANDTVDTEVEEKRELILTDRKFHNGREYVIIVSDSDKEEENAGSEDNPIDCWDSDENKKETLKRDKKEDEAQEIEKFNNACGDYEKPYHHERRLTVSNGSKSEEDTPKPKKMRLMEIDSDSDDASYTEGDISNETIDQLAHVISDTEGVSENGFFDKEKLSKKLEKMSELELQRNYDEVDENIDLCRAKIRKRIERKFKGVRSHKKVTQLHRFKAKLKVIMIERQKRLALLRKERNKLKVRKIYEVVQRSLNRIDEKWPSKGQNPVPGMLTKNMMFFLNANKELILMKRILRQVRVAYFERGPRCSRSTRGRRRRFNHRCRLNLSCRQHGGRASRPTRPLRVRCWRGRPCPWTKRGRVPRVQWIQHQQQHVQQLLQQHW